MTLRNMLGSDLPHVNLILSKAFTHARIQSGYQDARIPLCRTEFLEMYLAGNPAASFVIEKNDRIIAYSFSRLWGKVAWIGPLSVIPAEENAGFGSQIVAACVEALKAQGAETIGLEMSAASGRNLGFYAKLGFVPGRPVVDLIRKLTPDMKVPADLAVTELSKVAEPQKTALLERVKDFSSRIESGLDYTKEIQLASEFGFGDGFLFSKAGRTKGLVLAHTEAYSREEEKRFLKINVLQLAVDSQTNDLLPMLQRMEVIARERRLAGLYIRVPTRYFRAFRILLENGFKIINTDLRLTLEGYHQKDDPALVNINKWQ